MIYLDHAASTCLNSKAYEVLVAALKNDIASPMAAHSVGRHQLSVIDSARERWLHALQAEKGYRCIFTSSATESNNLVILGVSLNAGDEIINSEGDHPSTVLPVRRRVESGVKRVALPFNQHGDIDQAALLQRIDAKTRLLVLNAVNGQTGHDYNVITIATEVKAQYPHVFIHVDGAQAVGKVPFPLKTGVIDSLSISGHKLGGPKGCSVLIMKDDMELAPLLLGGGQEFGLRSSTQSMALIESMTVAGEEALSTLSSSYESVQKIKALLVKGVKSILPGVIFPFESSQQLSPYIVMMIIPGVPGEVLVRTLNDQGIVVSTRSACSSKHSGTIPIFTILDLDRSWHACSLRVSFSRETTGEEIAIFLDALKTHVEELRHFYSN